MAIRASGANLHVADVPDQPAQDRGGQPKSMRALVPIDPAWGVTAVRVMMGLVFLLHGAGKFMAGFPAMAATFAKMGIIAPGVMAPAIACLEVLGGACVIAGLFTRVFGLLFLCEMLVTTFWVQLPTRGWNGSELDRMLLVSAFLILVAGPGRIAADRLWLERGRDAV